MSKFLRKRKSNVINMTLDSLRESCCKAHAMQTGVQMPAHKEWIDLIEAPDGFLKLVGIPFQDWPDEYAWQWNWLGGNIQGHVRVHKTMWRHEWQRTKAVYRHEGKQIHPIRLIYPYFTGCDPDAKIRLKRQIAIKPRPKMPKDNVNPYHYEVYETKSKRPSKSKRPQQIAAIFDLWPLADPAPTSVSELLRRFPDLSSYRTCDLEETIKDM